MYLRVQLTLMSTLKKSVTSGWTPKWTTSDEPGMELGPAQLTFYEGDVVSAGDKSIAVACPLSPRLWRVRSGGVLWVLDSEGTRVAVAEVLEVFR